uniref:Uncharacterized protein n=1 Tax=Arundo donax TaxID=35708 RepID=A0A0A9E6S3_ARUDO
MVMEHRYQSDLIWQLTCISKARKYNLIISLHYLRSFNFHNPL